jgi:hypothetical protein
MFDTVKSSKKTNATYDCIKKYAGFQIPSIASGRKKNNTEQDKNIEQL